MAEDEETQSEEKTEEPTQKREEDFREEGHIPRSAEITSFVVMASAMSILLIQGQQMTHDFGKSLMGAFQIAESRGTLGLVTWGRLYGWPVVKGLIVFVVALFLVTLIVSLLQTGFNVSTKVLEPKLSSLNPIEGFQKLFQMSTVIQFVKNFLKVIVISAIAYVTLKNHLMEIVMSSAIPMMSGIQWNLDLALLLMKRISVFLVTIAILDYVYQRMSLQKKMMMSRKEIKDEMKENQLPDTVRNKVKQVQRERAKRTIQKEVPTADVVVTNPTHFAVALRYHRQKDRAPKVVAKGMDRMAFLIREIAEENKIIIYEYPELARGLYRKVRVGDVIPTDLYESVARVLAHVYQIHQRKKMSHQLKSHLAKGAR